MDDDGGAFGGWAGRQLVFQEPSLARSSVSLTWNPLPVVAEAHSGATCRKDLDPDPDGQPVRFQTECCLETGSSFRVRSWPSIAMERDSSNRRDSQAVWPGVAGLRFALQMLPPAGAGHGSFSLYLAGLHTLLTFRAACILPPTYILEYVNIIQFERLAPLNYFCLITWGITGQVG